MHILLNVIVFVIAHINTHYTYNVHKHTWYHTHDDTQHTYTDIKTHLKTNVQIHTHENIHLLIFYRHMSERHDVSFYQHTRISCN